MGTRSRIAIKTESEIKSVYCHWDGYLSNNGKILLENYNTPEKVENLINLGDMSSLHESIEKPEGHTFDTPIEGHTVFYNRDRNENWNDVKPQVFKYTNITSEKRFISDLIQRKGIFSEEYAYIFDVKTNKWKYWSCRKDNKLHLLTKNSVKEIKSK